MQYYDWDEWKSRANELKHGVLFEDAVRVFDDPQMVIEFDRVVDGEERWHAIGSPNGVAIILVAHIVEVDGLDQFIRLISARKVSPSERRRYEQNG